MGTERPEEDRLTELGTRLNGFVEAKQWFDLAELLTDLDFLSQKAKQIGPYAGMTGYPFRTFLETYLRQIPEEYRVLNPRLANMGKYTQALSSSLELHFARGVGSLDPEASCKECGEISIVHGDVDLGAIDDYDNYFSMCTNCFWAWHVETYNQTMSKHNSRKV